MPGIGVTVNGATRWLGAGPLQFQPSELLKVSIVLYAAQLLASAARVASRTIATTDQAAAARGGRGLRAAVMKQPDMGTAMVICFAVGALLVAAGAPMRNLALIGGTLLFAARRSSRSPSPTGARGSSSFMDPFADAGDAASRPSRR